MNPKTKHKKSSTRRERCEQDELLNHGLLIAWDQGAWAIQEELQWRYRWLKRKQAEDISVLAQEVNKFGYWLVDESVQGSTWVSGKQVLDRDEFDAQMRARYQWINEEILSRI
jgi:hypothetical protein